MRRSGKIPWQRGAATGHTPTPSHFLATFQGGAGSVGGGGWFSLVWCTTRIRRTKDPNQAHSSSKEGCAPFFPHERSLHSRSRGWRTFCAQCVLSCVPSLGPQRRHGAIQAPHSPPTRIGKSPYAGLPAGSELPFMKKSVSMAPSKHPTHCQQGAGGTT